MSRLIALYPAAWRERYEDEFRAVLAARPPSIGERVDFVPILPATLILGVVALSWVGVPLGLAALAIGIRTALIASSPAGARLA